MVLGSYLHFRSSDEEICDKKNCVAQFPHHDLIILYDHELVQKEIAGRYSNSREESQESAGEICVEIARHGDRRP